MRRQAGETPALLKIEGFGNIFTRPRRKPARQRNAPAAKRAARQVLGRDSLPNARAELL